MDNYGFIYSSYDKALNGWKAKMKELTDRGLKPKGNFQDLTIIIGYSKMRFVSLALHIDISKIKGLEGLYVDEGVADYLDEVKLELQTEIVFMNERRKGKV